MIRATSNKIKNITNGKYSQFDNGCVYVGRGNCDNWFLADLDNEILKFYENESNIYNNKVNSIIEVVL